MSKDGKSSSWSDARWFLSNILGEKFAGHNLRLLKWWLEYVRNIAVVLVLFALAIPAQSKLFWIMTLMSLAAVIVYPVVEVIKWTQEVERTTRSKNLLIGLSAITASGLISLMVIFAVKDGVIPVMQRLLEVQIERQGEIKPSNPPAATAINPRR